MPLQRSFFRIALHQHCASLDIDFSFARCALYGSYRWLNSSQGLMIDSGRLSTVITTAEKDFQVIGSVRWILCVKSTTYRAQ